MYNKIVLRTNCVLPKQLHIHKDLNEIQHGKRKGWPGSPVASLVFLDLLSGSKCLNFKLLLLLLHLSLKKLQLFPNPPPLDIFITA